MMPWPLFGSRAFAGLTLLSMAGAVAPLTTAVLSSVDGEHTGTASGSTAPPRAPAG